MIKTNRLLKLIYPALVWEKRVNEKKIFLTFDDGPVPGVTEYVLDVLQKYQAKATFFCVGENVVKHPEVFQKIVSAGHSIGNHTYNHKNGWKTIDQDYVSNIKLCDEVLNQDNCSVKRLFRPPYGRIKKSQIALIKDRYEIIMWDILTKDYDHSKSQDRCLKKSIDSTEPGSIVVFHDRYKNEERLKYMLPKYLNYFAERGYTFGKL